MVILDFRLQIPVIKWFFRHFDDPATTFLRHAARSRSFGDLDALYWKQNNCLDGALDPELNAALIVAQSQLAQRGILDFEDTLLAVIAGRATATEALKANKWGAALFGQ